MNSPFDNEIQLRLLKLLQGDPKLTQRGMKQRMGVSLGKVNYCLSALVEKGLIKVEQFKKHKNKSAYMYRLTPRGIEELSNLTIQFLEQKIQEYDQIKREIRELSEQIDEITPDGFNSSGLIAEIKKRI